LSGGGYCRTFRGLSRSGVFRSRGAGGVCIACSCACCAPRLCGRGWFAGRHDQDLEADGRLYSRVRLIESTFRNVQVPGVVVVVIVVVLKEKSSVLERECGG
jgi:hypothetical protein